MNKREQHIIQLIKKRISEKNPAAEVVLFGSHARGQANEDSDWDILILLSNLQVNRKLEKEYREALFDVELEIGEPISTFVYSKKDWESKHAVTPLYHNVQKEGIRLS
ncbi:nucleotidyltransferase domain-containing protein [Carboxylicivirga sp. A043]|uniref:nucleotidyltransferase domain-containing protein n=1 Tax=Carboxylicivirga litoralis TaxID=2816963 RepID=UPI0021CB6B61|nr:nucleotidyltransferase domain-containing protein [Carboxylicivirga sp. A043]MCU4158347.1 nucleotidyltransferase domain-containing protein [Carboxylicivirga sp. A043]